MEGPAVVTSSNGVNPFIPKSSANLQLTKDPEDKEDDFVLELDEAEINGSHYTELTDNKSERANPDAENSITNSELLMSSEPASTIHPSVSQTENSLAKEEKLDNDLQIENKTEIMHSEIGNEFENDKNPVVESANEIKSMDLLNESKDYPDPVSVDIANEVKDEPNPVAEDIKNEVKDDPNPVSVDILNEVQDNSNPVSVDVLNEVEDNPNPVDEPMEVADNFDSVDQELDSLLNAGDEEEEEEKKVFDNGDIHVPKEEPNVELDMNVEIKDENIETPVKIKEENSFETPVDDEPSNEIISDVKETEDRKLSDDSEENMDASLNNTKFNTETTVDDKISDITRENMEIPSNGTNRDEEPVENMEIPSNGIDRDSEPIENLKTAVEENINVPCNGVENNSIDSSELTNKINKEISSGEKPSDPEESNGESGKENRNKRLAEVDRKRNAKKIKMSSDSVPNGISNGLHEDEDSESCGEGNDSDNFEGESMSDSSSEDSIIDYVPEKKTIKKRDLTKKPPPPNRSFVLNKSKSSGTPEVYQKARAAVADSPFKDSRRLTVDGNMAEELVMMKVVEFLTVGSQNEKKPSDNAGIYKKCKIEEDKMLALQKRIHDLTKQVEDCKHIIKKLIEEKLSAQPWTSNVTPLRVTRSVGLQVCTVGSVNVINSRSKDVESVKQLLNANKQEPQDSKDDLIFVGEQSSSSKGKETSAAGIAPASPLVPPVPVPSVSTSKGTVNRTSLTSLTNVEKKASETNVTSTAQNRGQKTPTVAKLSPSNTPDSSSGKRDSTGSITLEKNLPPKVSACIDLTDSDDIPVTQSTTPRVAPGAKPTTASGVISSRFHLGQFPIDRGSKPSQALGSSLKAGANGCKVPNSTIKPPLKNSSSPSMARGNGLSTSGISNSSSKSSIKSAELLPKKELLPKLPPTPTYPPEFSKPPRPILRIGKNTTGSTGKMGIMLSWNFSHGEDTSEISEYQLYAYQENGPEKTQDSWKKVGDIKALPLPMACFLTQFVEGHKYHFAVRAIDQKKRVGEFSIPGDIILPGKDEDCSEVLGPSSNTNSPDAATRTKDN